MLAARIQQLQLLPNFSLPNVTKLYCQTNRDVWLFSWASSEVTAMIINGLKSLLVTWKLASGRCCLFHVVMPNIINKAKLVSYRAAGTAKMLIVMCFFWASFVARSIFRLNIILYVGSICFVCPMKGEVQFHLEGVWVQSTGRLRGLEVQGLLASD